MPERLPVTVLSGFDDALMRPHEIDGFEAPPDDAANPHAR